MSGSAGRTTRRGRSRGSRKYLVLRWPFHLEGVADRDGHARCRRRRPRGHDLAARLTHHPGRPPGRRAPRCRPRRTRVAPRRGIPFVGVLALGDRPGPVGRRGTTRRESAEEDPTPSPVPRWIRSLRRYAGASRSRWPAVARRATDRHRAGRSSNRSAPPRPGDDAPRPIAVRTITVSIGSSRNRRARDQIRRRRALFRRSPRAAGSRWARPPPTWTPRRTHQIRRRPSESSSRQARRGC